MLLPDQLECEKEKYFAKEKEITNICWVTCYEQDFS